MKETICTECTLMLQNSFTGQGFTSYKCKSCDMQKVWHNTGTPELCLGCAESRDRCMYCSKPIDDDNPKDV